MRYEAQIARFWLRRVSQSLRAHSQTRKHWVREWARFKICTLYDDACSVAYIPGGVMGNRMNPDMCDRAERVRMCRDGRGLGTKLVSFAKGFSKHTYILAIFKVDSEYLRYPLKLKVDYFTLYSILVSTIGIFLLLFSMNKRGRTNNVSLL